MEMIKSLSPDLAEENFRKLATLFPNAVTETVNEEGKIVRAIDKEVLMQEINNVVVDKKQQRYQFTWPDKNKAIIQANTATSKTLRLQQDKSISRDGGTGGGTNSENIYIEGDNLDALKILRETYLGKVKMIYIDPPYNTGNDFIYNDKFAQNEVDYENNSGQTDEDGNQLVQNMESNGRFHTDWLNMIYPRIKLARDLLSEDGVIFISIDDNEYDNLKKICDEVFGIDKFVTTIHIELSTTQGMKVKAAKEGNIVKNAEYILCYSKDGHKNVAQNSVLYEYRQKYDEHYSLYIKNDGSIGQLYELYDYRFPKDCKNDKPYKLSEAYFFSKEFADIVRVHHADIVRVHHADIVCVDKVTGIDISIGIQKGFWKEIEKDGRKYLLTKDTNGNIKQLLRLSDSWGSTDGYYSEVGLRKIRGNWWKDFYIDMGNVSKEGNITFSNGKKPVRLIKQLAKMCTKNETILDFFSGSATTAHAVMQLNAEDGGHRKFIMVQLPEATPENSDAYKAGYKTICDIGKERIFRAGQKIKEETGADIDYGFRYFKVDSSNMKDVFLRPSDTGQMSLNLLADNIKEDRTPEDLLIQSMLKLGILLSSKIEQTEIAGKKVFSVADGYLIACFDENVTEDTVTAIAKKKPIYAVFRDSSMANDSVIANFEQIFETYSPKTERRVI
ncbi:MAG: site-specific DNA-methyltransferase [Succinivibrionaceae bacterium]